MVVDIQQIIMTMEITKNNNIIRFIHAIMHEYIDGCTTKGDNRH